MRTSSCMDARTPHRAACALVLAMALLAATHAPAPAACNGEQSGSGEATFYDYSPGSGACSFAGDDSDPMVAAINATDWAGSQMCGRWLRVTGPLGSVDVRIVDQCPSCPAGDLDLNRAAFERIGDPLEGRIDVTWQTIPDPTGGNVSYQVSAGSNAYYLQVQPRHARYGIASLEVLGPSGFVTAPRANYNYFIVDGGLGLPMPLSSPFTVRLTDVNGQAIVQAGIPLEAGSVFAGDTQFPACEGVGLGSGATTGALALAPPSPNPFRGSARLTFDLPREGHVSLRVFDASGRRVGTVVNRRFSAGRHHVRWTGLGDEGRKVAAGVYFARLTCGAETRQRTLVLMD